MIAAVIDGVRNAVTAPRRPLFPHGCPRWAAVLLFYATLKGVARRMLMITIFAPDQALHDAPHEFLDGKLIPPHEAPIRVRMILEALERAGMGPIQPPRAFELDPIRAVHDH